MAEALNPVVVEALDLGAVGPIAGAVEGLDPIAVEKGCVLAVTTAVEEG